MALCEGPILGIGRIWADGQEIAPSDLNIRLYTGSEEQLPDPLIDAVEGAGNAPAYRGIAYVVIEDLELAAYGNRVPQLSFRSDARGQCPNRHDRPLCQGVALMPGTGDFNLCRAAWSSRGTGPAPKPGWPGRWSDVRQICR